MLDLKLPKLYPKNYNLGKIDKNSISYLNRPGSFRSDDNYYDPKKKNLYSPVHSNSKLKIRDLSTDS